MDRLQGMHTPITLRVLAAASLALLASACGQDGPRGDPLRGGAAPTVPAGAGELPAGHPPIPSGHPPAPTGLPPVPAGHPPMDGPTIPAGPVAGAPPAGWAALTWTAPPGWTQSPPANAMRVAQLDLPGAAPGAPPVQCVVFGGIGGGKEKNIDRWIGQFVQPGGGSSKDLAKVTESEKDGVRTTRVSLRGNFTVSMVPGKSEATNAEGWMLLGAIVETSAGEFQVKLVGPAATLEKEEANFDAFLSSIKVK